MQRAFFSGLPLMSFSRGALDPRYGLYAVLSPAESSMNKGSSGTG